MPLGWLEPVMSTSIVSVEPVRGRSRFRLCERRGPRLKLRVGPIGWRPPGGLRVELLRCRPDPRGAGVGV